MTGIGLELVAKAEDEVVHRAREGRVGIAPDQMQQLITRHDVASAFGEAMQDLELPIGQLHTLPSAFGLEPSEVDHGVAEPQLIDGRLGPAKDRMDPGQQFVEGERFHDVVISAEGQSTDAVLLLRARRR